MKKFLKTNGYYLILIVCVFAVCIAGVVILEHNSNDDISEIGTNGKPASADEMPALPTDNSQQSSANGGSTSVSKPVKPTETATPEGTPAPEKLILVKPLSGKIAVGFSDKKLVYNKTLKEWKIHPAIDISGKKGDEVKCAMAGTVTDIKSDPLYGTTVIIDNGKGTKTVYCGISAMNDLTVGKQVTAGSVLGILGDTIFCESETGTHLHFEVIQNGKKVDPTLFFPKETSADASDENDDTQPTAPIEPVSPEATSTTSILQPSPTSVG